MPIFNRDTFTPSLSEMSYYHREVCARKSLVVRCSLLRQPGAKSASGRKSCRRSERMIRFAMRY